jgi:hypothetical membrane protein
MSEVVSQPNRIVRYSAIAGIVGPVLYTITWLVLGFLEPTYSHTRDPISNLSAIGASFALVMTVIIFVFAILIIVFAFGLQRGLPPGFWGGPVALVIAGVGYVGIALAPLNLADPGDPNVPHTISATVTVFAMMLAPILTFPRLRRDPGWRNLSGYSIATTAAAFAFMVMASLPTFADWAGLMQRLVLAVFLVWMVVIAIRLYVLATPSPEPSRD